MPVEKAGKDQRFPYGFSHFECGNTGPIVYCASHLEIMKSSTKAYILNKVRLEIYQELTEGVNRKLKRYVWKHTKHLKQ